MSAPSFFRSSMLRSSRARNSGSLISLAGSTCAAAERSRLRHSPSRLIPRIHRAGIVVGRVGYRTDIGYQRLNIGLAKRVAPGRHEGRFVERRAPVTDDGAEIGIADLVERIALGEGMRLDFEIVEVGYALHCRLGIVAALAVLIVELASQSLLIAKRDLFDS